MINYDNLIYVTTESFNMCVLNTVPVQNYYTHNIKYVIKNKLKKTTELLFYK